MNNEMDKLEDLEACYITLYDQHDEMVVYGLLVREGDEWWIDGIYHADFNIPLERIIEVSEQGKWVRIKSDKGGML